LNLSLSLVLDPTDGRDPRVRFLHASLQLDSICSCLSLHDVRQTLEAFPAQIEEAYRQTCIRIVHQDPKHVLLAKLVLLWVLNARRSMTIEELRHALATSPDTHVFEHARLVPEAMLIGVCRGLVTVEEESKRVRLVRECSHLHI
jgi:ankyrin repeat domain-containing protein 50